MTEDRLTNYVAMLIIAPLVALLFIAFAGPFLILGWQTLTWLKDGYWPSLPVSRVLEMLDWPYPMVSWLGVQRIIDWFCALPSAVALPILGSASLVVSGSALAWAGRP